MSKQITILGTVAVCLAYTVGLVPGNTSPLLVGGLIAGLGLGVADAGMILSIELILMGAAAIGLAARMSRIDARGACLAGAVILLFGHGLAAQAGSLTEVVVWRSTAGIGAGVVLAAVNATIAGSPNPTRLYGLALVVPPLIGSVIAFLAFWRYSPSRRYPYFSRFPITARRPCQGNRRPCKITVPG